MIILKNLIVCGQLNNNNKTSSSANLQIILEIFIIWTIIYQLLCYLSIEEKNDDTF